MGVEAADRTRFPSKIGRYPVLGYLADGGMAEIYLGRDGEHPVVIKRILPHLARQPNFVSMFIDEARIGSLVQHPNVVTTHELGQVGSDLFLVMEYLAGENVSSLLRRAVNRRKRIPFALGAFIIAEACLGLHAAHELCDDDGKSYGLVHRDVSPSNLFVTYNGDVKVLDFGVATAAHRLTRTVTGQVKGKFSYMAPEQCLGQPLDRRTDIFALGVVLYELTTGHRLFKRANELLVLRALTQDAVPVPSRKIVDYPAALERVVMRALSRDPDRRQATALELRSELLATIPFEGNPRVALAMIMEELFPERIAEKRELVRNVRAGTEVPNIPAAEVDESVEMPGVEGQRTGSLVASSRSGLLWAIVLVLLAAGGVAGAWWYTEYGRSESSPSPSPSPSVSSMPVASAAPALVTNDATEAIDAAQRFVVHVESIPSGATLIVDGETKGVTPFDLERAAPGRIGLELQLEGHVSVRQDLDVEHEQHLLIPLPDVPVAAPATTPSPRPHKKPKPDPFQRFD